MNIVIAEKNIEVADNIRIAINQYLPDCQLSVIDSGKQCLKVLKNGNCPDALILGFNLSDMCGLDLLMNIRDDSDLPIILVSEDEDINMLIKAFDNGANDYFTVPFNANIFAAKLNAIVRRRTWDSKAN